MSDVKWIKLSVGIFDDEKIRYIEQLPEADSIFTIWVKLLVLAGKKNMGGEIYFNDEIPYTDEMLSAIFHRKVNTVRMALETFSKLRMIEISADRTIIISNWGKHQNIDGLDKLREQAAERARRHRLKRKQLNGCDANATHHVIVTAKLSDVTLLENKKEIREEPLPSPKGDSSSSTTQLNTDTSHHEAREWLNGLFGRKRAWTGEEEELLANLLPISRDDRKLLEWAYNLDPTSSFFDQTRLKQELVTLLRDFNGELDKIRSVRRQLGIGSDAQPPAEPPDGGWTLERKQAAFDLYGDDLRYPLTFTEMGASACREVDERVRLNKAGAAVA